jgi:hypothetical protein
MQPTGAPSGSRLSGRDVGLSVSHELLRAAKRVAIADANIRRAAVRACIEGPPFDQDSSLFRRLRALLHEDGRSVVLERLELLLQRVQDRSLPGGFWRDLMRASEVLGLQDRLAFFAVRFQQALQTAASRPPGRGS